MSDYVWKKHDLVCSKMRKIEWERDKTNIQNIFATTWKKHPILTEPYFNWQFLGLPNKRPIAFCSYKDDHMKEFITGLYTVIPTTILTDNQKVSFSTSVYTITHPEHYGKGLFTKLAVRTYDECNREGIIGTVGVPNNNSLHGFTNSLGFKAIGKFAVIGRIAKFPIIHRPLKSLNIKEISSDKDMQDFVFDLDKRKADFGVVLFERNISFISWRFLNCPSVHYNIAVAYDHNNSVLGMVVLRKATKKSIPLTVIVDLIVDHKSQAANDVVKSLLAYAMNFAWQHFAPIIITLLNPYSFEARALNNHGFYRLPNIIMPHESNFIIKLHDSLSGNIATNLYDFKKWYFSFADYDIF